MNPRLLLVLFGGEAVMATTVWATYPGQTKSILDPGKCRYMHCEECGRERMYHPDLFDQPCPYCEKRLVATEESVKSKSSGPTGRFGLTYCLLGVELVGLMAAILVVAKQRQAAHQEELLYFNCGRCGQKIRFRESQVGTTALCPRCKRTVVFPEPAEDEA